MKKADNGNRTRLSGLGSQRSTDEPYLHGNHYSTLTLKFQPASAGFLLYETSPTADISNRSKKTCKLR